MSRKRMLCFFLVFLLLGITIGQCLSDGQIHKIGMEDILNYLTALDVKEELWNLFFTVLWNRLQILIILLLLFIRLQEEIQRIVAIAFASGLAGFMEQIFFRVYGAKGMLLLLLYLLPLLACYLLGGICLQKITGKQTRAELSWKLLWGTLAMLLFLVAVLYESTVGTLLLQQIQAVVYEYE